MTDPISNEILLPCPFCGDPMEDRGYGAVHVAGEKCPIGGFAIDIAAGVEPVAWEGYWPGAGSIDSITSLTRHRSTMEQWKGDGAEITPLYASPTKTITITDEMRQAIRVLKLIADGYSAKGDGLGEFVQVENPDYRPDNGSDPYIVVDITALSSEGQSNG